MRRPRRGLQPPASLRELEVSAAVAAVDELHDELPAVEPGLVRLPVVVVQPGRGVVAQAAVARAVRDLEAVQERCRFEPGELRIVTLESQPVGKKTQRYRIYDAATGLVEDGYVRVADMVGELPWLDASAAPNFPVEVVARADSAPSARAAAPA